MLPARWAGCHRRRSSRRLICRLRLRRRRLPDNRLARIRSIIGLAVFLLILWQMSWLGVRVGEAAVPGPHQADQLLRLASVNVTWWVTQDAEATALHADVVALQETRLSEIAKASAARLAHIRGYTAVWGKGCPTRRMHRKGVRVSATVSNCAHGGVGIMAKNSTCPGLVASGMMSKHVAGLKVRRVLPKSGDLCKICLGELLPESEDDAQETCFFLQEPADDPEAGILCS